MAAAYTHRLSWACQGRANLLSFPSLFRYWPHVQRGSLGRSLVSTQAKMHTNGDLNNNEALRPVVKIAADPRYAFHSLAIEKCDDDDYIRTKYRPFLLPSRIAQSDWVARLELSTVLKMVEEDLQKTGGDRLKILVLYGSLRSRSYSRLLAFECARILFRLGCDVRIYDPQGLPVKDDVQHGHPKVQELRELSKWSDGHVWVSPEQHGNLVCHFEGEHLFFASLTNSTDCRVQKSNRLGAA